MVKFRLGKKKGSFKVGNKLVKTGEVVDLPPSYRRYSWLEEVKKKPAKVEKPVEPEAPSESELSETEKEAAKQAETVRKKF